MRGVGKDRINSTFYFENSTPVKCEGDVIYLCDYTIKDPKTFIPGYGCFQQLFNRCTALVSSPEISLYNLSSYCCYAMFDSCRNLKTPPTKLPATEGAYSCYGGMFNGCGIESLPEICLTELEEYDCESMFYNCNYLTDASSLTLLPENLSRRCYSNMFGDCDNLIYPPKIEALYGAYCACNFMFSDCMRLVESPVLKIKNINEEWIYEGMFYGCSNLSKITCLAEEGIDGETTSNWVHSVADNGTFICAKDVEWIDGDSGIPTGWEVRTNKISD